MTVGSNALAEYKGLLGKNFERWFPPPDYDSSIRESYRGGFSYVSERYRGREIGKGIVLDVNSLYPAVMYYDSIPYGEGIHFSDQYQADSVYDRYIQTISCQFDLKPNHLPTVYSKQDLSFLPTQYLSSSDGEVAVLCLCDPDLSLFLEHYDVYDLQYLGGWKFKSSNMLFRDYIDKWNGIKIQATEENNQGMRTIAKLMLNNLYGKFATNPKVQSKHPILGDDDIVHYVYGPVEKRKPVYIPAGSFITSWARYRTITSAQKVYDRFVYADTDSLHLEGWEIPEGLEIDDFKLGAWKIENHFTRGLFLRPKTYLEEVNGVMKITCAGMPDTCYGQVTWENFRPGMVYGGKLRPTHNPGGIVLEDSQFTLRK